ncbi:branched-chain amino acid ABC transporter permease [Amorphus sp. 3PC139-8]|uniref:branched-chain amino acid ABC transporter permease n=1 Tax=Amorphus sp. 3PC139-8 TaxID=2735676 RepID=UPI00345D129C
MNRLGSPRLSQFVAILAGALLIGATLPLYANAGIVFLAGLVAIDIVIALAFNFLFATVGVLSFGQAGFILVGAYAAGVAIKFSGVSILPTLILAGVASAFVAMVIGLVALRRVSGVYFAVLTLAFASLGFVAVSKSEFLGREDGLTGITRPDLELGIAAISLTESVHFYYFVLAVCAVLIAVMWYSTSSQFGRTLKAIKQDADRSAFLGINVQGFRVAAFVLAGAVTGMAGALLGPLTQIVTPDLGYWTQSTKPILYAMLGGSGFFWGPAVGAVLFAVLSYATRTLVGMTEVITGGLLLVVVLAIPGGVLGVFQSIARLVRRRSAR